MAFKSKKDARLFVGSTDVSADIDTMSAKITAQRHEHKPLAAVWPVNIDTGMRSGEVTASGLYAGTSGTANILATVAGTNRIVSVVLADEAGGTAYCFESAMVTDAEVGLSSDSEHTLAPGLTVNGEAHAATVVAPLATRVGAANTDSADADGIASSTGATGILHCTGVTGSPTAVTVTVRSSADAVTYANCTGGAFANFNTATSEVIAMTGTVERYLSISWAYTGGTSPSWTGTVCVARD